MISSNVILYCEKWAETVAFYEHGLRLPVATRKDWFVEFKLTPTSFLSVADQSRASIRSSGGRGITIGLRVADLAVERARLLAAGLAPTAVKQVWGAEAFYLFDPEGHRIEVWEDGS